MQQCSAFRSSYCRSLHVNSLVGVQSSPESSPGSSPGFITSLSCSYRVSNGNEEWKLGGCWYVQGGDPFQSYGQQRQPMGDQRYGYDRQGSQGQQRYQQQQHGGQDQEWNQRQPMAGPGPGARDHNQYNEQPLY